MISETGIAAYAPRSMVELASWAVAGGAVTMPGWVDWLRDVSLIATLLTPILGILLTFLLIMEAISRRAAMRRKLEAETHTDQHTS